MPDKNKKVDRPFIKTIEHQQLTSIGVTVITPTASVREVNAVLGSQEFKDAVIGYTMD